MDILLSECEVGYSNITDGQIAV